MSDAVKVGFVPFSAASRDVLVVLCDDALKFGAETRKADQRSIFLRRRESRRSV